MKAKHEWSLVAALAAVAGVAYFKLSTAAPATTTSDETAQNEESGPEILEAPILTAETMPNDLPAIGQWRGRSLFADLNNDGHLDLVSSIRRWDRRTPAEGIYVWLGDGEGNWTESLDGLRRDMGYGGSSVADVDGDGFLDIAFSGHDITPHLFLGGADGFWTPLSAGIDVEVICSDVALADYTGDGYIDLATLGFYPQEGGLVVFEGDGTGGFSRTKELLAPVHFGSMVTADDIDGDGSIELIATSDAGTQVWSYDASLEDPWVDMSNGLAKPEIGGSEVAIVTRDLDGDGTKELLIAGMIYENHPGLQLFQWDGSAWQSYGPGFPHDEAHFDAVFATLDPEKPPYLITAGRVAVNIWEMVAPGDFRRLGRIEDSEGILNLCAGDVDGDSVDEIALIGFDGIRVIDDISLNGGQQ